MSEWTPLKPSPDGTAVGQRRNGKSVRCGSEIPRGSTQQLAGDAGHPGAHGGRAECAAASSDRRVGRAGGRNVVRGPSEPCEAGAFQQAMRRGGAVGNVRGRHAAGSHAASTDAGDSAATRPTPGRTREESRSRPRLAHIFPYSAERCRAGMTLPGSAAASIRRRASRRTSAHARRAKTPHAAVICGGAAVGRAEAVQPERNTVSTPV